MTTVQNNNHKFDIMLIFKNAFYAFILLMLLFVLTSFLVFYEIIDVKLINILPYILSFILSLIFAIIVGRNAPNKRLVYTFLFGIILFLFITLVGCMIVSAPINLTTIIKNIITITLSSLLGGIISAGMKNKKKKNKK